MIPYLALLASTVCATFGSEALKGNARVRSAGLWTAISLLVMFQGLRSTSIGTDTGNYKYMYDIVTTTQSIWVSTEIGYNALNVSLSLLTGGYFPALQIAISAIVVGFYCIGIVKMTSYRSIALLLFIFLGSYTFSFNAARQGIAVAVCFLALHFLVRRRAGPYFALVGVSALFHYSAVVVLPLYFLSVTRIDWRFLVWVAIGIVAMMAFLQGAVEISAALLNDRYAAYAGNHAGGGEVMVLFLVVQGGILFWLRPKSGDNETFYARLLGVYLIGLVPAVTSVFASSDPSGILRLNAYFAHTAILLWPIAFYRIKAGEARAAFSFGIVCVMLSFFYMTTSTFSNLAPYDISSEILP